MKTSAGQRGSSNDKFPRRLELVREVRPSEKPVRRYSIGMADNLLMNLSRCSVIKTSRGIDRAKSPIQEPTSTSREQPETGRVQVAVGLAVMAGLAVGYLLGKRRW